MFNFCNQKTLNRIKTVLDFLLEENIGFITSQ